MILSVIATPAVGGTVSPPEIEQGNDANGSPFTMQTYEAAPTKFDIRVLPIAERFRRAGKWGGSIPALDTSVLCEIADNGEVKPATCEADSWLDQDQLLAMSVVRASPLSIFPKFPAIDRVAFGLAARGADSLWSKLVRFTAVRGETPPFFRLVRLAVQMDESRLVVDLTTGPLVDLDQIDLQSGTALKTANYPVRAMREKRQGTLIADCQVQADRSVICRNGSFDPPENTSYFTGEAERLYRGAIVKERLKDGTNSSGVRFQTKLRWVLPAK